ncbi:hypothetical protein B0H13DRAFT_1917900 [Mycena leptocephala]|nr:hypothetical protein B0H13DRAFT_1917900 [Mycena leptocephala]
MTLPPRHEPAALRSQTFPASRRIWECQRVLDRRTPEGVGMISQAEKKAKQKKNKISSRPPKKRRRKKRKRKYERRVTLHAAPTGESVSMSCGCGHRTRGREENTRLCNCLRAYPSSDHVCHPSIHPSCAVPTMAMVPRKGSRRGPGLPDISRREDSMTKRRASPVVHRTHGVPDVAMDGGRIYEGEGQHHDKMRRE